MNQPSRQFRESSYTWLRPPLRELAKSVPTNPDVRADALKAQATESSRKPFTMSCDASGFCLASGVCSEPCSNGLCCRRRSQEAREIALRATAFPHFRVDALETAAAHCAHGDLVGQLLGLQIRMVRE